MDGKIKNKKTDPELNFFKWLFLGNILFHLVIYGEIEKGLEDERGREHKSTQEVSRNFF